ncbi:MAG: hypothetical protein KAG66_24525, partial [Methylococcales bacterium]|nr:hypothetical protein [Methylococcales bacterium]
GKPSRSADSLSQIIHQLYPALPVTQAPDVFDAFDQALKITTENVVIVITGSLYLIGQAREKWHPIKEGNN